MNPMQADNQAEEIDGLGLILIHNSGAWKNVYQKKLPRLSVCSTGQTQLRGSVGLALTGSSIC